MPVTMAVWYAGTVRRCALVGDWLWELFEIPGRWLVSLGNRQIVKSTAIADWQQKAGSWSAQRGGVWRWRGRV